MGIVRVRGENLTVLHEDKEATEDEVDVDYCYCDIRVLSSASTLWHNTELFQNLFDILYV